MKKRIFLQAGLVATVILLCLYSCNKTSENVPKPVQSETIAKLEAFNKNMLMNRPPESRGFWDTFGKVCSVASADILGAGARIAMSRTISYIAGGVTGGTGALVVTAISGTIGAVSESYHRGKKEFSDDDDKEVSESHVGSETLFAAYYNYEVKNQGESAEIVHNPVEIRLPERFAYLEQYGQLHNDVLAELEHIINNPSPEMALMSGGVEKPADPEIYIPQHAEDVRAVVMHPEYVASYEQISKGVEAMYDDDGSVDAEAFFDNTPDNLVSELTKQVYIRFMDLYTTYPQNFDDIATVINGYIDIIEASDEFTEEDREAIYIGFAVAAYSPVYWYNKLNN